MNHHEEILNNLITKFDGETETGSTEEYASSNYLTDELRLMRGVEHAFANVNVDPVKTAQTRAMIMTRISEIKASTALSRDIEPVASGGRVLWIANWIRPLKHVSFGSFAAAAVVAVFMVTTYIGAVTAIPGNTLYSTKLAMESLQLSFSPSEEEEAALYLQLAERRLGEVQQLANLKDYEFIKPTLARFEQNIGKGLALAENIDEKSRQILITQADTLSERQVVLVRDVMAEAKPSIQQGLVAYLDDGTSSKTQNSYVEGASLTGSSDVTSSSDSDITNSGTENVDKDSLATTTSVQSSSSNYKHTVNKVDLSTRTLSPNNDGRNERLLVSVQSTSGNDLFLAIEGELGANIFGEVRLNSASKTGEDFFFEWNGKSSDGDYAADGVYYVVISSPSEHVESERRKFTIDTTDPATPVSVGSAASSIASVDTVLISWNRVADAERYIVEYSTTIDFPSNSTTVLTTSNTQHSLELPQTNGAIYWRITAEDAAGNRSHTSSIGTIKTSL